MYNECVHFYPHTYTHESTDSIVLLRLFLLSPHLLSLLLFCLSFASAERQPWLQTPRSVSGKKEKGTTDRSLFRGKINWVYMWLSISESCCSVSFNGSGNVFSTWDCYYSKRRFKPRTKNSESQRDMIFEISLFWAPCSRQSSLQPKTEVSFIKHFQETNKEPELQNNIRQVELNCWSIVQ